MARTTIPGLVADDAYGGCPHCGHQLPEHVARPGATHTDDHGIKTVFWDCRVEHCVCTLNGVFTADRKSAVIS